MSDVAGTKKCPQCAEDVQAEAKVCRYCGHRFESRAERIGQVARWPFIVAGVLALGVVVYLLFIRQDFAEDFESIQAGDQEAEIVDLLGDPDATFGADAAGGSEGFIDLEILAWKRGDTVYSVAISDGEVSDLVDEDIAISSRPCDEIGSDGSAAELCE